MNYRYGMLATALAVGLLALPASAAVSDVTGGSTTVNTKITKHYTEKYTHRTNDVNRGVVNTVNNREADDINIKYRVEGTLNYHETSAIKNANGTYSDYEAVLTGYSSTSSNLSDARNQVVNSMAAYEYNNQDGRVGGTTGYGNEWNAGPATYVRTEAGAVDSDRIIDSQTKKTADYYTAYREYRTDVHLDNITSSRDVDLSNCSILIGDPDAIANAYAAQGTATVNEFVDKYYTRTHNMERDHVKEYTKYNTWQRKVNRTEVYQVNATRRYSPIILDLDGDGKIEASNGQYLAHDNFSERVAMFDFFGNGFPLLTEWVGPNDGLLCRPTAEGKVTGAQLFGTANGMANGYEEMASLDADNSGALEGAELQGLYVWTDLNGNAQPEKGELKSLEELGITSIKVSHNNYSSTFERQGQTYKSFDWWPNCRELRKVDMASVLR